MLVSIVVRTYNEEKHLEGLLVSARKQECKSLDVEIVLVDSGSTDRTLEIAKSFGCKIVHINKNEFTFGRSLNRGCEYANGDVLVFISGHCIPVNSTWLQNLIQPVIEKKAVYVYGRQIGDENTKFSEQQVFNKYFPEASAVPQQGFFCNNANAALLKSAWEKNKFSEELTGLEDMHLAKQLLEQGKKIAYVAEAPVYHIHDETWNQVKIRYEREAVALRKIMPEVHVNLKDFIHYYFGALAHDFIAARRNRSLLSNMKDIVLFRLMQYWGSYRGNHEHRKLSTKAKYRYFYPKNKVDVDGSQKKDSGALTHESS